MQIFHTNDFSKFPLLRNSFLKNYHDQISVVSFLPSQEQFPEEFHVHQPDAGGLV